MKTRTIQQSKMAKKSVLIFVLSMFLGTLGFNDANAQERNKRQMESLLTAKKWTVLTVSKKKLTKLKKTDGFRMEQGNEMSFSIDHKFGYKNNDYEYMSGKWVMDGKRLLLVHDARDATNRLENSDYKIKKLTKYELVLKRLEKPRGILKFK